MTSNCLPEVGEYKFGINSVSVPAWTGEGSSVQAVDEGDKDRVSCSNLGPGHARSEMEGAFRARSRL